MKIIKETSVENILEQKGFDIINEIYNAAEVDAIIQTIENASTNKATFRKTNDLFCHQAIFERGSGGYSINLYK